MPRSSHSPATRRSSSCQDVSYGIGTFCYGKRAYAKYDGLVLQRNKFVTDPCADEATGVCRERLKAAAAPWKSVRESDMEKRHFSKLSER